MGACRRIGRYAVFDELASGGMASVHIGRLVGPGGFSRTVAVKLLHTSFAKDSGFSSMLLDEARIASRIRSLHVIPTLEVVAEGQELALIMEYVPGETVARVVSTLAQRGQRIPWRVAVAIVAGALRGLHDAHETQDEKGNPLGIVHRDVSPQNILIGVDGIARVLDFGVAKAAGRFHESRSGEIKGKLSYMPPEQLQGGGVTRLADVYAASVTLWEALTGARLFAGETDAIVIGKTLRGRPDAPSTLGADVPEEIDAIVLRGLSKNPDDRFATALQMALALEEVAGVVPPAEIASFVSSAVGDTLTARSVVVRRVESTEMSDVSEPGSPSTVTLPEPALERRSPRGIIVTVLALALFLGVSVFVYALARTPEKTMASPEPRVSPPSASPTPPEPLASASAPVVAAPSAPVVPVRNRAPQARPKTNTASRLPSGLPGERE